MPDPKPRRRYTLQERENALFRPALAVAIERNGGDIEYTEGEYQAIVARHGTYVMRAEVDIDESDRRNSRIRIAIVPDNANSKMPVS